VIAERSFEHLWKYQKVAVISNKLLFLHFLNFKLLKTRLKQTISRLSCAAAATEIFATPGIKKLGWNFG
jgi:hypothetical protein